MKKAWIHKAAVLIFCAVVTVSFVTLVPTTLNYLELWVALSHLQLQVDSFSWSKAVSDDHDSINISANLFLLQNSSYVGLKLHSVDVKIEYGEQYEYLYERRFWFFEKPLDPFAKLNLTLSDDTASGTEDFIRLREQGKPVQLHFSTSANVFMLGQYTADRVYLDVVDYTLSE